MLVVADASPLVVLVNVGHVDVLPKLFESVTIPTRVAEELGSSDRPRAVRDFMASSPPWLAVRKPSSVEAIAHIHAGEREAICLARELRAALLLIDDLAGRRAAVERELVITGTIGVLELAAEKGLLDLAEAFERVKQTDFWISPRFLDARLERHRKR